MSEAVRRLFVYGSLLHGEPDHALLRGARCIGAIATEPAFQLIDLGPYAAAVDGGPTAIRGELYAVDLPTLSAIDVQRQVPVLFQRVLVRLGDGSEANAYLMASDQVTGRRRLHDGDWRRRFASTTSTDAMRDRAWSRWARGRFRDGGS